jgi:hypothetical protein
VNISQVSGREQGIKIVTNYSPTTVPSSSSFQSPNFFYFSFPQSSSLVLYSASGNNPVSA